MRLRKILLLSGMVGILASGLPLGSGEASGAPVKNRPAPRKEQKRAAERGLASWFRSKKKMVVAHRTLPFGTRVKVLTASGRSVIVTVADRGPFIKGRIIDLSSDAFKKLTTLGTGLVQVTIQRLL